jgi:hypothetical protein
VKPLQLIPSINKSLPKELSKVWKSLLTGSKSIWLRSFVKEPILRHYWDRALKLVFLKYELSDALRSRKELPFSSKTRFLST